MELPYEIAIGCLQKKGMCGLGKTIRPGALNKWYAFFENMCHAWIKKREISKCTTAKNSVVFVITAISTALGIAIGKYPGIPRLLIIALALSYLLTLVLILGFDHVNEVIEVSRGKEYADIQQKKVEESFWYNLTIEYRLLMEEIIPFLEHLYCEEDKDASRLYTKLTDSIVQLITEYLKIERRDFAIHLYVYDKPTNQVQRVKQVNFCNTVMNADENSLHRISRKESEQYYYEKNIIKNKSSATYTLLDNAEIRNKLNLNSLSEDIKKQYSQYVALAQDFGNSITLYAEVIAFNEVRFGSSKEELETFVRRTITPLFRFLSKIEWDRLREEKYDDN